MKEAVKAERVGELSDPELLHRGGEPEEPRAKRRGRYLRARVLLWMFGCSPHAVTRCQLFTVTVTVADPTHLSVTLRHVLKRLLVCFLVCAD